MNRAQSLDPVIELLRHAISESFDNILTGAHDGDEAPRLSLEELLFSPEAEDAKAEMIRAGEKLWRRQYVDGNGGNLSVRIGNKYAVCTPTLCSKGDLTPGDFALVDLEGGQICGGRERTSEILLHLEIYKAQPAAGAVIHCHPPYATAHAVAGTIPEGDLVPEQEVFVGPLALAPYETPGTIEFARAVLPFVNTHNTILLRNHGIVCWADTIAHAEWYTEVVENYCKTVRIASSIKTPLPKIPEDKIHDLLRRKQRMGLPDPRLAALPPALAAPSGEGLIGNADLLRHGAESKPGSAKPASKEEEIERLAVTFAAQIRTILKSGSLKSGV